MTTFEFRRGGRIDSTGGSVQPLENLNAQYNPQQPAIAISVQPTQPPAQGGGDGQQGGGNGGGGQQGGGGVQPGEGATQPPATSQGGVILPPLPGMGQKMSQQMAFYSAQSPIPPIIWQYQCQFCPLFEPATQTCKIVDGTIAPAGWCLFWLPSPSNPPFMWLIQQIGLMKK